MSPLGAQQSVQVQQIDEEREIYQFMATNSREDIRRLIQEIKRGVVTNTSQSDTSQGISTISATQSNLYQDAQDPYEDVKL